MSEQSFSAFLWQWIRAATNEAIEAAGVASLVFGGFVWGWHKYYSTSFSTAAARIGWSPDSVMTDLVWQVPLGFGFCTLAYRFLRAPYEIVQSERAKYGAQLDAYRAREGRLDIDIEHGGYFIAASAVGDTCALPGVWIVFYQIVITNRSEHQVPLDLWLHVGVSDDGSQRYAEVSESTLPAWVADHPHVAGDEPLDRVVNLAGRSAIRGFCAARMTHGILDMAGVKNTEELATKRAFWLEAKDLLSNEALLHPMNYIARDIDRREADFTKQKERTESQRNT